MVNVVQPLVTNVAFVTSVQFVCDRFVEVSRLNPVALCGQEIDAILLVNNSIFRASASTTKELALVPVPAGATTLIGPVVALVGTVAVNSVLLAMEKVASAPLNRTAVTFVKLEPVTVTTVPAIPCSGVKLVTLGLIKKFCSETATPPGVVTVIGPLIALTGIVDVMVVLFTTPKFALTPLNATSEALVKFFPVNVTNVPAEPVPGTNPLMNGGK